MHRNVDKRKTVIRRIEDADTMRIERRKDNLAIGSQSCSCENAAVTMPAREMSRNVDKAETVVSRIEDANTIGIHGREDDLAASSRNCSKELVTATQLRGNVDGVEAVVGRRREPTP